MKLPQLYTILARETVDGLSFVMFYVECLCYITSTVYGFVFHQNFFIYGHNLTLFIQTLLISFCFVKFHSDEKHRSAYKKCLVCLLPLTFSFLFIPKNLLNWIELSTSFFNVFCRYPQIDYCYWNMTADNLNWIPIALSVVGNIINICGYYYIANANVPQIVVATIVIILDVVLLLLIYKYGDTRTSPNFKFVVRLYYNSFCTYITELKEGVYYYCCCCLKSMKKSPNTNRNRNEINLNFFPSDYDNPTNSLNDKTNYTFAKKSDITLSLSSSSKSSTSAAAVILVDDDDPFNSFFGSDVINNNT